MKKVVALFILLSSVHISFGQPVARFITNKVSGCAPLKVQFYDSSKGEDLIHFWDFGDGRISNRENPVHIFYEAGKYKVELEVQDNLNQTDRWAATINVYEVPVTDFTFEPRMGFAPATIKFQDQTNFNDGKLNYSWQFNPDGANISSQNPDFTFQDTGVYQVKLITTTKNNCTDSISKQLIILPDWSGIRFSLNQKEKQIRVFCKLPKGIREAELFIADMDGQKLYSQIIINESKDLTIDIREYAPGTYRLILKNKKKEIDKLEFENE